jgi:hypothetical protein
MTAPTEITLFEVTGSWLSVSAPFLAGNTNDPHIEPVSGLVTLTPRLPKGTTMFVNNHLVTNAYNTLQQIFLIANPTAGTWRLSLDAFTTAALPFNATAAQVKAAIESIPTIGAGNVAVSIPAPDTYKVEFINKLAMKPVPAMVAITNLSNASLQSCPISVTVVNQGTAQVVADTAVALPPITARIWKGRLCTIDSVDSPGVRLAADCAAFNGQDPLIYDVIFSKVWFNGTEQFLAPFAFVAPATDVMVCITDPALQKLPYSAPIGETWTPATTAAQSRNWRLRAV